MPSDIILITGGSGHVGFKVLVNALECGYDVRAAIRDPSKEAMIRATESIKTLNPGPRLSFVIMKDISTDGAYDEAVKGVKYIIHVASPLAKSSIPPKNYENELIIPAMKGTVGILESAYKTSSIKRIVITASSASIVPTMALLGGSDEVFDETSKADTIPAPFPYIFVAYCASKIAAYKATNEFIAKQKPIFDVISLMPTFIIGKNELVTDPERIIEGSNGLAFSQILGQNGDSIAGCTVHINDVAKAYVQALDPNIPGDSHFLLNSGELSGTVWEDAINIVAKSYPWAVAEGILPNNGIIKTKASKIDARKFLSYEEQIKSVTSHYLELVAAKIAT
ncbi:hypothetical protein F5884DRAFT_891068 [Xylogone sp. PMI_703]|nr:hypothetical protein F5884DRAFT_891068 [Xylogone sp. PMI_703]